MQENLPKYTVEVRPPKLGKPPIWAKYGLYISVCASWIPLAIIVRARYSRSPDPRPQLAQDMGTMPKYKEQQSSDVFIDGRADRLPIPGTVARGEAQEDDHYYRGYETEINPQTGLRQPKQKIDPKTGKGETIFFDTFPSQVKVNAALVARGQNRFNIYCTPCHGYDGSGHGMVNERGLELSGLTDPDAQKPEATWVQAADLRSETVRNRPVGHIYNTINVGIRNMPAHGPQIPVADRWAIVSYVRSLQLSQNGSIAMVPENERAKIKAAPVTQPSSEPSSKPSEK